jgi:protein arginine N-methyltransferase 1
MITETESSTVLGQFIPLHYHFNMLGDRARMRSFKEALQAAVPQGGKVLELGGGTGVLSFFAAQRASKVWCVERDPVLVAAAKEYLSLNSAADKVEVIEGDAMNYLPPEPVDVVVCEMLHVALLREKQIQVIRSFKERYKAKFGDKLPLFIPEATILAAQPVHQNFNFSGYYATVPVFYDPLGTHEDTKGLGDPLVYQMLVYNQDYPDQFRCEGSIGIRSSGTLNALRFTTKNALAIIVSEKRAIEWFNQYMVLPIPKPIEVKIGDEIRIKFSYHAGDSIQTLTQSIQVSKA